MDLNSNNSLSDSLRLPSSSSSASNDSAESSFNGDASTSDMSTFSMDDSQTSHFTTIAQLQSEVILSPGGYRRRRRVSRPNCLPEDTLDGDSLHLTRDRVPVRDAANKKESDGRKGTRSSRSKVNTKKMLTREDSCRSTASTSSNTKLVAEYDAPLK